MVSPWVEVLPRAGTGAGREGGADTTWFPRLIVVGGTVVMVGGVAKMEDGAGAGAGGGPTEREGGAAETT